MAFHRRAGARFQGTIWPGFVDAITALLMVMIFVLTIFMVVQYVLNEEISNQDDELNQLNAQLNDLSDALGLARGENARLEDRVATLGADLAASRILTDSQTALIARLGDDLDAQAARIADFEAQVAGLLAANNDLTAERDEVQAALDEQLSEAEALSLALAQAREEVDAAAEAARRDAAEREALEALIADMEAEAAGREATLAQTLAALEDREAETAAARADLAEAETALSEEEAARLAEQAAAAALRERLSDAEAQLSEEEAARLAEAAAAERLRERLENSEAELTAMTLALEEQRREAEETLTLLAAAREAEGDLTRQLAAALAATEDSASTSEALQAALDEAEARIAELSAQDASADMDALQAALAEALAARQLAEDDLQTQLTEAERQAALLAQAEDELSTAEAQTAEGQRQIAVLNQQVAALRAQLGQLQALLDASAERDAEAEVQIETLGAQLNAALAAAAVEQSRRADVEAENAELLAAEAARLQAENADLASARSEFFGRLRALLEGREGVQVVGDRFVFSSEVLFAPGEAELSQVGRAQIAGVAELLLDISSDIPANIDWVLRVDGHTDDTPTGTGGPYANNWELSQARALSVVLYLIDEFDFPPDRLAANGFGEFQPIADGESDEARAANRRIELKLTER
ncbi:peptidoglycan -binding protein [Rhodobacterales bacterium HKCCE2091]|nr:peptidoglycan -binding protein [Rhodobacterales bacterium HKCCE2091]